MARKMTPQYKEYQKAYHAKYDALYYQKHKRHIIGQKAKRRSEKQKWFREFKLTLLCSICGENCVSCLEFHHRNPNEKEYTIGDMMSTGHSIESVKREIEKCDILCANCHRKVHCKCEVCQHA